MIYLELLHVSCCFIFCEPAIFQASKLPTEDGGMRGEIIYVYVYVYVYVYIYIYICTVIVRIKSLQLNPT